MLSRRIVIMSNNSDNSQKYTEIKNVKELRKIINNSEPKNPIIINSEKINSNKKVDSDVKRVRKIIRDHKLAEPIVVKKSDVVVTNTHDNNNNKTVNSGFKNQVNILLLVFICIVICIIF